MNRPNINKNKNFETIKLLLYLCLSNGYINFFSYFLLHILQRGKNSIQPCSIRQTCQDQTQQSRMTKKRKRTAFKINYYKACKFNYKLKHGKLPSAPFRQLDHEIIPVFSLFQLDHAPRIILAKKKKPVMHESFLIKSRDASLWRREYQVLINLSHARNLITSAVGASRIRHGMTMVPVGVHFKNLNTSIKNESINMSIDNRRKKIELN